MLWNIHLVLCPLKTFRESLLTTTTGTGDSFHEWKMFLPAKFHHINKTATIKLTNYNECINNYLLTECDVFTGKYQTEGLTIRTKP